jgi:uncharacterized RDD family membrane protein YckC
MLLFLNFLILIFGIVLFGLAISWKPQPGKGLFVGFVSLTFIAFPVSQFLFVAIMFLIDNARGGFGVVAAVGWLNAAMLILMLFAMMVLLILFAIARKSGGDRSSGVAESAPITVWETHLPAQQLIGVLRRREWAFLIDALPAMLVFVATLFVMSITSQRSYGYRANDFGLLLNYLMMIFDFFLYIYIIFRDSVGGASLGKRIVGCRVVNAADGEPAGFGACLVRNLVFVFPFMAVVELAAASFRADRRRIGDLIAGTFVVHGLPKSIDGVEQKILAYPDEAESAPVKHALDD